MYHKYKICVFSFYLYTLADSKTYVHTMPSKAQLISLVIPAYREEKNISLLYKEIQEVLVSIKKYSFEIIFIDDGSSDNTWQEIEKICKKDKNVKWIHLSRNFGKEIALTAGIEHASGNAVITLDGDGQHPVEKIPLFIWEWEKWYEIVYNRRPKTKGASFLKKLSSKVFYSIFNTISEFKLEEWTTDYRLLDRKVVDYFLKFNEKNRLYRGLTDWLGFTKKALVFNAKKRLDNGTSSYSYKNLFNLAINSMTSFSIFPLKLVGYLGTLITTLATLLLFYVLFDKLTFNLWDFSNIVVIVILNTILMGVVLMSLWLIALYIAKIHEEVLGRPMYIIKNSKNLK